MPEYSASEIIGSSFWAKKKVDVLSSPFDDAPVIRRANKGDFIGTVYSFLNPTTGRSTIYWMFYTSDNTPFYVKHDPDAFDLQGTGQVYAPEETDDGWGIPNNFNELIDFIIRPKYDKIGKWVVLGVAAWATVKYVPPLVLPYLESKKLLKP